MTAQLRLRPGCLDSPGRLDVAELEVQMLFPDPAEARFRARALEAVTFEHLSQTAAHPIPSTQKEVQKLVRRVSAAPRMDDLAEMGKDRFRRGVIAGKILHDAVGLAAIDPTKAKASISRTKQVMGRAFWRQRLSEKTINNSVWPVYRCVAHFWAAWLYRAHDAPSFPCTPNELGLFLAIADEFRRLGETFRTPQSPSKAILRCGESMSVPPGLLLPRVTLNFTPI